MLITSFNRHWKRTGHSLTSLFLPFVLHLQTCACGQISRQGPVGVENTSFWFREPNIRVRYWISVFVTSLLHKRTQKERKLTHPRSMWLIGKRKYSKGTVRDDFSLRAFPICLALRRARVLTHCPKWRWEKFWRSLIIQCSLTAATTMLCCCFGFDTAGRLTYRQRDTLLSGSLHQTSESWNTFMDMLKVLINMM